MTKRLAAIATLVSAAMALLALCSASAFASTEESPWWQVLTGSRPSNLWVPSDNEQEIKTEVGSEFGLEGVVALVEVEGGVVGCLGSGTAAPFCGSVGFAPTETAEQLETLLEGVFGTGAVEVTGGPVGGEPFRVIVPGRPAPEIAISPFLGTATSKLLAEGGSGRLVVTATNLGDAPVDASSTPLTIIDEMPTGVVAYTARGEAGRLEGGTGHGIAGPVDCQVVGGSLVSCKFEGELPSYEAIEIEILASLGSPPSPGAPGRVTVSGSQTPSGGEAPGESALQPIRVSNAPVSYGLESFNVQSEEEGGLAVAPTEQAGAHPFQWTNTVQWNVGRQSGSTRRLATVDQPALPRNTRVTLPPGLVGNATAIPKCPLSEFLDGTEALTNECPDDTAIGVASATVIEKSVFGLARLTSPIFNLPPQYGEPARFGFMPSGTPVIIDTSVDPDDDYKVTAEVRNASQVVQVLSATLSIWGVPGDPRHNSSRGWACAYRGQEALLGPCEEPGAPQTPFLRMPVSCSEPLAFRAELEPWNVPIGSVIASESFLASALRGCNKEPFGPGLDLTPTSKLAENPSGLDATLRMPNAGLSNPADDAISETQFKKIEVELPEGVTVNPSEAEGLSTCSPADYARERFDSGPGEGCPEASKIGNVKISTPLLEEEAEGALYIAAPYDNPFHSLVALYLVARVPERGVLVKQAGLVSPDPQSGQLVTTFDNVPQLPIDSFKLHFREGGRAPLVTPPHCGSFQTTVRYVPWSAQDPANPKPSEVVEEKTPFTIERGVDGGACPTGAPPFNPGFEAGSLNNDAGGYSAFDMRLTRGDGDQDLTKFSAKLPEGMTAKLAGVAECSDADIAQARSRTGEHGGQEEKEHPSCPAGSQIGTVTAGAGVGSILTYVPGKLYLAGPYKGAPLSAVAIVPGVAGPFDVGTVVTREALRIDPRTAEVEADGSASDPIPHILKGIPLKVRDIRVQVDRPDFTLNPTSCEEMSTEARIWSGGDNVFSSADDVAHSMGARFQAADCRALGFKPRVSLRLRGGTRRGAFPALRLLYRPRQGAQANLRRFAMRFPHSEFIEQGHFRTICTRVQFAAGRGFGADCPKGSVYGHVKAYTPILDQPLRGTVFLRSSSHSLPDVVLAMQGPASLPVKVEVPAKIDSVHGGLRAIASETPDVPITRVVLDMQGGKKGLFVNSTDICHGAHRARVRLAAHNGRTITLHPPLRAVRCRSGRRKTHRRHRRRAASRSARGARH